MLNPLIAEDLNAGHGATSGRLSVRESTVNVLHFIGHLLISALGVGSCGGRVDIRGCAALAPVFSVGRPLKAVAVAPSCG
jgi:hypothetical protein